MKTQKIIPEQHNKVQTSKHWLLLALIGFFLMSTQTSFAQVDVETTKTINLKGKVSDLDGPLFGINVLLKDSNIGVLTNEDGSFTFPKEVQIGDTIIFSYLGYKDQEILVTEATPYLDINLELDALTTVYIALNNDKPYQSKRSK